MLLLLLFSTVLTYNVVVIVVIAVLLLILLLFLLYSGVGNTTTLAEFNKESLSLSNYMDFLDSARLITGAILVSTAPCQIVGMTIGVDASIREANAGKI